MFSLDTFSLLILKKNQKTLIYNFVLSITLLAIDCPFIYLRLLLVKRKYKMINNTQGKW